VSYNFQCQGARSFIFPALSSAVNRTQTFTVPYAGQQYKLKRLLCQFFQVQKLSYYQTLLCYLSACLLWCLVPVFTYCDTTGLGWSDTRKRLIGNIERRSLTIIAPNSSNHSADLRIPSVDRILKRSTCLFVFDCLHGDVCNPFKNYFVKTNHALNTRNNQSPVQLPRMKLEIWPSKLLTLYH